ncbi:hypothetical protein Enr13x_07730 [Stieleria neptunia]|uniref:Uncharacterized protein n=1 Tax=Stieleria neptunia TaxID=2527979 RepID=A0A518HJA5_9BACT|nr:hypothetical protein [Stieleria neptunia]QDV40935.1 hypothetical protein Enr13x_07730 [Stieleria neptunia]
MWLVINQVGPFAAIFWGAVRGLGITDVRSRDDARKLADAVEAMLQSQAVAKGRRPMRLEG